MSKKEKDTAKNTAKDKEKEKEYDLKKKEFDVFREPPLRYFGYSNEVCKAIRPILPCGIGNIGSIMTICYIFTDVYDKGRRRAETYRRILAEKNEPRKKNQPEFEPIAMQKRVAVATGDALVWQSLASVLIPGFLLEKTRYVSCRILQGTGSIALMRYVPSILSLALIPFIINPIDTLVDSVMNCTYRKWFEIRDDEK